MSYKPTSTQNLSSPNFPFSSPQSPLHYFQKPSFSTHFIDNSTVCPDDDYELEA